MRMIQAKFVEVGGVRIHSLQAGEGAETILLLHGGGVDGAELSWKLTIPVLAERYRVVAPDWPGYGKSGDMPGGMTQQQMIKFVVQFMDEVGIQQAHLVGLSMGGGAALGFTLGYPEKVSSLTLVDSYGLADKAPMHLISYLTIRNSWIIQATYSWMKKSKRLTRWTMTSILKRPGSITPELVDEVFQAVQDERGWQSFEDFQRDEMSPKGLKTVYMERLHELDIPVLIVHGEKDGLVPVLAARKAAGKLKQGKLVVIPGCGHWPGREAPEEFNRAVMEFLQDLPKRIEQPDVTG